MLVFGHHHVWSPESNKRHETYFGINPDDSERLVDVFARRPALVGYFAGHTHRNRVRRFAATGDVPWVEVACVKDFPGRWAEYRVFEGGILQVHRRISSPEALEWTERTRAMFGGLYPLYAFGALDDRCFAIGPPPLPAAPCRSLNDRGGQGSVDRSENAAGELLGGGDLDLAAAVPASRRGRARPAARVSSSRGGQRVRRVGGDAGRQAHERLALADQGHAQPLGRPHAAGFGRVLEDEREARVADLARGVRLAQRLAQQLGERDEASSFQAAGFSSSPSRVTKQERHRPQVAAGGRDPALERDLEVALVEQAAVAVDDGLRPAPRWPRSRASPSSRRSGR